MAAKFAVTGDQIDTIDRRMDEIKRQLRLKGGSPLDPERVAEALQRIVEGRFEIVVPEMPAVELQSTHTYCVIVGGQSLAEMITTGRYDSRDRDITQECFPIKDRRQVQVELHLVHLGHYASADTVLVELDRRHLRPATIEELLALGAKYPNLQKEFPILALGSVWQSPDGDRLVACLGYSGGARNLHLSFIRLDWGEDCRFLAASK